MAASNPNRIRVLLVDDHAVVRQALRMLIESRPGLTVIGEADNCRDAVALAAREQPDIVLLDLDMGGQNSLDSIPDLLEAATHARILVLTAAHESEVHYRAVRLGAMGLVLKEHSADVLIKAIEKVSSGEVWLDRSMLANVLSQLARPDAVKPSDPEAAKIGTLTSREREVVTLIGEGLKNRQIAERLFISETTVRHHLTSVFDKLGVSDRLELMIYAYRHGLVEPPR